MSEVVKELVLADADSRLEAITGLGSYEVEPSGDPARFPALALYEGSMRVEESETGTTRYALFVTVEGYVEGGSGKAARAKRSALHAEAVKAMMTEPFLEGIVETVEEDGDYRPDVAELAKKRRLGFAQDFKIIFVTARGDPTQPA